MLLESDRKSKIGKGSKSANEESVFIEILKAGQECPNCHFADLKSEGGMVSCPICGYGSQGCG